MMKHRNYLATVLHSKNLLALLALFLIFICGTVIVVLLQTKEVQTGFILQKVVIVSRHNARTPTSQKLNRITPHPWPKYEVDRGHLTKKGFQLEGLMGKYFSLWLDKENLIKGCPSQEEYFVYADNMERTLSSAKAFTEKGYPHCNITIHHSNEPDVFTALIHNTSEAFKEIAIQEMHAVLNQLNLNVSYLKMQQVLNYEQSELCQVEHKCHLTTDTNKLDIIVGKKPVVSGPLKISNEAADALMMAFYNGFPEEDIGWGHLKSKEDWDLITQLQSDYHNVAYNTSQVARDMGMPLLKYMRNIFLNDKYKATMLMGHDGNILVLLNLLSIKPFILPDSFVDTPIGGKLVFEKWLNVDNKKYYLKVNYVYQSTKQLREGIRLSLENPPKFNILHLNYCTTDAEGYCLWDDFVEFLKSL